MIDVLPAKSLLPPPPHQQSGWGRFKWIAGQHSTASVELIAGFGSLLRGSFQFFSPRPHDFQWTGPIPLEAWAGVVSVCGFLQIAFCLYRWDRGRSAVAAILAGLVTYIVIKYLLLNPHDIALILYAPLIVGQSWIALRGHRMLGSSTLNGVK